MRAAVLFEQGKPQRVEDVALAAGDHVVLSRALLPAKLEHARAVGATHLVDASGQDPAAAIRPGGTCVLIGVAETGAAVPNDARAMATGERVVCGSS